VVQKIKFEVPFMRHSKKRRRKHGFTGSNESEFVASSKADSNIIKERPDVAYVSDTGEWIKARSERQKDYIKTIRENDLTVCVGPAGTGKTFIPVALALQALKEGSVARIIITRPAVEAGEKLGFLPGDFEEKIAPYLRPIYDALYYMVGPEYADTLIRNKIVEVAPLAYMRGRTLESAFIIMDESQNATMEQLEMLLTRTGVDSKVVVTGDVTQVDLPKRSKSGLIKLQEIIGHIKGVSFFYFHEEDVVRHPLVREIVKAYEAWKTAHGTEQQ
jgi:phosphate starvation-inducible PhoH-like protein